MEPGTPLAVLALLVKALRKQWPGVRILLRADSGFCRWKMLRWCERHQVDYVVGLAKNARLDALSAPLQAQAEAQHQETKEKVRLFGAFDYQAHTWDRPRRVIAKAEHNAHGPNPRYLVTSLAGEPQSLYDERYCARGEVENRIKEQQLALFSDRTSSHEWWREPVSAFALLLCLRAFRDAARPGAGGHRVGPGPSGHHPARNCLRSGRWWCATAAGCGCG
jgi:hypothetical protein